MKFGYVFLIALLHVIFIAQSQHKTVVRIQSGPISGETDQGVLIFKGVPFAAPPVGALRWKDPVPHPPWQDTLECKRFGPSGIQNYPKPFSMWSQEFITPAEPLSEDCLYLNVWAPEKKSSSKFPVMVWIHGGAFNSGSGAVPIYDGVELAKQGIVYVSINYRLGVFGFLAHPDLTKESSHQSSGNYGLMDQVAALQWVKDNIEVFGGDPKRVTIAGQSAGSFSVHALVASPLCKGLISAAIAQSGSMSSRPAMGLTEAEQIGNTLGNGMSIEMMRSLPADTLLARANRLNWNRFFPIIDTYVLPADVKTIFANKLHNDVPLLTGWVTGDGDLRFSKPLTPDEFRADAKKRFGEKYDQFNALFPSDTEAQANDSQRRLAAMQFAGLPDHQWLLGNKSKGYLYEFTYVPTDKPGFPNYGAFHTSEVPYALHTLHKWDRQWKEVDFNVQKYLNGYWVNFVKTGNPNGKGLPEWKPYEKNESYLMQLGERPQLKSGLYAKEFALLESVQF